MVVIANQNLALVLDVKKRIVDAVRDNQVNFPHSMYHYCRKEHLITAIFCFFLVIPLKKIIDTSFICAQEAVAVTTAIQEEILLEMGIGAFFFNSTDLNFFSVKLNNIECTLS